MKQQLLLLGVCAAFALLAATADAGGAEFTPSVVLTTVKEMENNCDSMVDNALTLNSKEIKFVPTVHFFGSETNINSYCFRYYGHSSSSTTTAAFSWQQIGRSPSFSPASCDTALEETPDWFAGVLRLEIF
jgi:hypothetical protein